MTKQPLFYRIRDICAMTGMSRGRVYAALRAGDLEGRKLDGTLLITVTSVDKWLDSATPWRASA